MGMTPTHGMYQEPIYHVWESMKQRCDNKNNPVYKHYGGRGITYTEDWKEFISFFNWAVSSGYSPSLELDRLNNELGYSPSNCRWVTRSQNCLNKRSGKNTSGKVGVSWDKSKKKWVAQISLSRKNIYKRFDTVEEAIEYRRDLEIKYIGFHLPY